MWTASLGASRHPLASLQQLQDELRSAGGRSPSELFGRVAVVDVGHVAAMFFFFGGGDVSHGALVLHGGAGLDFSCNFDILFFWFPWKVHKVTICMTHGNRPRWSVGDPHHAWRLETCRGSLVCAQRRCSPGGFFWFLWKHQRWQPCYELYLL